MLLKVGLSCPWAFRMFNMVAGSKKMIYEELAKPSNLPQSLDYEGFRAKGANLKQMHQHSAMRNFSLFGLEYELSSSSLVYFPGETAVVRCHEQTDCVFRPVRCFFCGKAIQL